MISAPIEPAPGTFDPSSMARGEPGLPSGFVWRGRTVRIGSCERVWKRHRRESTGRESYLRRHYYALRMEDGSLWTVYCLRQPPTPGATGGRWFLYTVE